LKKKRTSFDVTKQRRNLSRETILSLRVEEKSIEAGTKEIEMIKVIGKK
jgi:hypothetical protein